MAGHPLRPATDHSLGEPLPHQLANRARAPPQTPLRALSPKTEVFGMSCGISPAFAGVSPIRGQIAHVLRTRAPCADFLYCYRKLRTRLACVKHAASVRSEPGSNSHVKLAAWKNKKARLPFLDVGPKFSKRTFYRSIHSFPHPGMAGTKSIERVLAHLILPSLSKSISPCPAGGYRLAQQL